MDGKPRDEPMDDQRYLVSATSDDDDVQIVVAITPEVRKWGHRRGYDEQSVVEAAIAYLIARQRVDELPAKLFLEDVAAAPELVPPSRMGGPDQGNGLPIDGHPDNVEIPFEDLAVAPA